MSIGPRSPLALPRSGRCEPPGSRRTVCPAPSSSSSRSSCTGYYTALETLPSIRPAALPRAALEDLHELRRFRHFFRNAYVLDLDPSRVESVADVALRTHVAVAATLSALREHIEATIAELMGSA